MAYCFLKLAMVHMIVTMAVEKTDIKLTVLHQTVHTSYGQELKTTV
jgi:hypothetical protein